MFLGCVETPSNKVRAREGPGAGYGFSGLYFALAVCSVQCAMCSEQYAVCNLQCAVCSVQCVVFTVQCAVCSV
jgi:hypothetical protein